jgi:hypothetical protein
MATPKSLQDATYFELVADFMGAIRPLLGQRSATDEPRRSRYFGKALCNGNELRDFVSGSGSGAGDDARGQNRPLSFVVRHRDLQFGWENDVDARFRATSPLCRSREEPIQLGERQGSKIPANLGQDGDDRTFTGGVPARSWGTSCNRRLPRSREPDNALQLRDFFHTSGSGAGVTTVVVAVPARIWRRATRAGSSSSVASSSARRACSRESAWRPSAA